MVNCEGGEESMCCLLKDKFGISWQIVPTIWEQLTGEPVKGERAMIALMQCEK
ncbi:MAG TPA: VOC family protein [Ginsengibacter sp.]|nr:VOC family protein [Ginsengibacter sp.]